MHALRLLFGLTTASMAALATFTTELSTTELVPEFERSEPEPRTRTAALIVRREARVVQVLALEAEPIEAPALLATLAAEAALDPLASFDLPDLPEGLLLDPDATPERIAEHYALTSPSDMVRLKHRLDAWLQILTEETDQGGWWVSPEVAIDPLDVADSRTRHFLLFHDAALKEQVWLDEERTSWSKRPFDGPLPVREGETERWSVHVTGKRAEDLAVMAFEARAAFEAIRTRERDRKVALGEYTSSKPFVGG